MLTYCEEGKKLRVLPFLLILLLVTGCSLIGPSKADLYLYLFNVGTDDTVDLKSIVSVNGKENTLERILGEKGAYFTTVDIPFDTASLVLTVEATIDEEMVSFTTTPMVLFHESAGLSTSTILEDNAYLLLDLENKRVFAVEDPVKVYGELSNEGSVVTLSFEDYVMKVPVCDGEFLFYLPRPDGSYGVDVSFNSEPTSLTIEEGRENYEVTF